MDGVILIYCLPFHHTMNEWMNKQIFCFWPFLSGVASTNRVSRLDRILSILFSLPPNHLACAVPLRRSFLILTIRIAPDRTSTSSSLPPRLLGSPLSCAHFLFILADTLITHHIWHFSPPFQPARTCMSSPLFHYHHPPPSFSTPCNLTVQIGSLSHTDLL